MQKTLPLWAAVPIGAVCGAVIGTIIASFYLTLALKVGFSNFDMLAVWKAGEATKLAHPEAFKVAFGDWLWCHWSWCAGVRLDLPA